MNDELSLDKIKDKYLLKLKEAAIYFNIGESKLKEMTNEPLCEFVLFNGNRRLIKKNKLEEYLDNISVL